MNGTTIILIETRYCKLKLKNLEKEAILCTEDFDYTGSITLKDAKCINDMLTGSGTLVYKSHGD